jgi:hypothetical protein
MKLPRISIEIVIVGTIVACALALLIAVFAAVAEGIGEAQTTSAAAQQTYEGMVTCSRCGARHSAKIGKTAGECTRTCVRGGANFVLVDGDKTYLLDVQPDRLKNVIGQRARIVGVVAGSKMRVTSVLPSNP